MQRASLWLVALLAGCSFGGEKKTIDEDRVDELVLQRDDLDSGYRQTWIGNLGRRPMSEVRYQRGPMTIRSAVSLLRSNEDADKGLDATREAVRRRAAWQPIDEPGLGDESFAATALRGGVRSYEVYWRQANATASLRVRALQDSLPLAHVLDLARKQQGRLEAASE